MAILMAESGGHTMSTSIEEKLHKNAAISSFWGRLAGSKVYYRKDWDAIYFDLVGKQFGIMSSQPEETAFLTLKICPRSTKRCESNFLTSSFQGIMPIRPIGIPSSWHLMP